MKFVSPKNDVAFKKIFGNEKKKEILISFLNAVLDLSGNREIIDIEILNPWQAPRLEYLKETTLDVRAKDMRGISFIVEMQAQRVPGLKKRFMYYAAKAYSSQIERGGDYPKLNQVFFIGILDFNEFENEYWHSRHILINTETCGQELGDLEFNFIELPKFDKKEHELRTILDKWIYFIKHAEDLEIVPNNADTQALKAAYESASQFAWTREDMELYDYWGIKEQDQRGAIQAAIEEGTQAGLQQGRKSEQYETARKMLSKGYDPNEIIELTGIAADEIAGLM